MLLTRAVWAGSVVHVHLDEASAGRYRTVADRTAVRYGQVAPAGAVNEVPRRQILAGARVTLTALVNDDTHTGSVYGTRRFADEHGKSLVLTAGTKLARLAGQRTHVEDSIVGVIRICVLLVVGGFRDAVVALEVGERPAEVYVAAGRVRLADIGVRQTVEAGRDGHRHADGEPGHRAEGAYSRTHSPVLCNEDRHAEQTAQLRGVNNSIIRFRGNMSFCLATPVAYWGGWGHGPLCSIHLYDQDVFPSFIVLFEHEYIYINVPLIYWVFLHIDWYLFFGTSFTFLSYSTTTSLWCSDTNDDTADNDSNNNNYSDNNSNNDNYDNNDGNDNTDTNDNNNDTDDDTNNDNKL